MPPISRETAIRLSDLAELLRQWAGTVNLVAPSTLPHIWERHIEDSLSLLPSLGLAAEAADLGSGAGFPGLVLSIAADKPFVLIEADARKASFLREAIRITRAPATVHLGRAESFASRRFPLITARGFAPLTRLIATSRHLLAPGGRFLLLKGRQAEAEITAAADVASLSVRRHVVPFRPETVIVEAWFAA